MQNLKENFDEYSDVLNADFSNWEDDFFSENTHFFDMENVFDSKNLIKSLQSTNTIISQNGLSPVCRKESSCFNNVATLTSRDISMQLLKYGPLKELRNDIPQEDHKQMDISSGNKNKRNIRKNIEHSDSEDFNKPNKKHKVSKMHSTDIFNPEKGFTKVSFPAYSIKSYENSTSLVKRIPHLEPSKSQSDAMTMYSQEICYNQTENQMTPLSQNDSSQKMRTSSQETSSQKMSTSSQETSSQKMSTSSQESSSQKMSTSSPETSGQIMSMSSQELFTNQKTCASSQAISTDQKMIASSQENFDSQSIPFSQELCISPKMIKSSQESLGNKVMSISIEDDSNMLNATSQSSSGTPYKKKFNCEQILGPEVRCTKSNIFNCGIVNIKKIKMCNEQSLGSDIIPYKKAKIDFSNKITENSANSVSDSLCTKPYRRYNKTEKRILWNIRKRELGLDKRENEVENREKLLDAREADIQKREDILIARERRYLRCKAKMKRLLKK